MEQQPYRYPSQVDFHAPVRRRIKWIFGAGSILLWLIAAGLPAFSDGTAGATAAAFGWAMLFDGNTLAFLAWLGNLPWLIALIMLFSGTREKILWRAVILSAVAVLFSFGALTVVKLATNEGGATHEAHPTTGTFIWMLSEIVLLCGCIACALRGTRN